MTTYTIRTGTSIHRRAAEGEWSEVTTSRPVTYTKEDMPSVFRNMNASTNLYFTLPPEAQPYIRIKVLRKYVTVTK